MPQLNQLAEVLYSQLFWLLLVLALLYFGVARAMVPKIQSTVDSRERRIAGDLAAAEAARRAADSTEEAYRARIDESRDEAMKVTRAAKQESARAGEARVKSADRALLEKTEAAEARLRDAAEAALGDIEAVAAEAAREMVARLARLSVAPGEAQQAVKAVLAHV
jgi:F-type H+-transporting ATPase subunit b